MECDLFDVVDVDAGAISTHALTWSATEFKTKNPQILKISTHALTWSATDGVVECDDYVKISTHALTWSATCYCPVCVCLVQFQLTHSREVRHAVTSAQGGGRRFQLTHSRGVRPSAIRWRNRTEEISTHALTWSATFRGGMAFWICQISTHALTWSATRLYDICRL